MSQPDQNLPAAPAPPATQPAAVVQRSGNLSTLPVFASTDDFNGAQRIAKALAASQMVPAAYQGEAGIPNCLIALEFASQCRMSVLAVMQNLNVIQGRPSWSATFLIASVNACGRFSPLKYERQDLGDAEAEIVTWSGPQGARRSTVEKLKIKDFAFRAVATEKATGEKLIGPWISMKLAHEEGWTSRAGNKYRTMPETMLMYRAASAFTRLYCPEISLGMHTNEEALDYVDYVDVTTPDKPQAQPAPKKTAAARVNAAAAQAPPATAPPADDVPVLPDTPANAQSPQAPAAQTGQAVVAAPPADAEPADVEYLYTEEEEQPEEGDGYVV